MCYDGTEEIVNENQHEEEEICDDGTKEVVLDEEDMTGFFNDDVEYVGRSGEESGSDSGINSKARVKGEKLFGDESSNEDSDCFYNNNDTHQYYSQTISKSTLDELFPQ